MPRISVSDGPGPIQDRIYTQHRPELKAPADAMRKAVHQDSILPWRIRESVRYRIAIINGCVICQAARIAEARDAGFTDAMYEAVQSTNWRESELFTAREKIAIDFAERFALDHESIDDERWEVLHAHFSEPELVDLTFLTGRYVLHGREQLRALLTRGGSDIRLSPMSPTAATTHCMTIVICRRRKASRRMEKEPHASM